jgi:hypothetical protein
MNFSVVGNGGSQVIISPRHSALKVGYPGRLAAETKTSSAATSIPINLQFGFGHAPVASAKAIWTDCHCKAPGGPRALLWVIPWIEASARSALMRMPKRGGIIIVGDRG